MSRSSCRAYATRPRPSLRRFTVLLVFLLSAGAAVAAPALAAVSISGTVLDEDGWTADAVRVDSWMSPDGAQPYLWAGVTDTCAAGGYVLTTPGPGSFRLSFSDPLLRFLGEWWSNKRTLDEANDVWVSDGETRSGIKAILSAAGRAGGVVTAAGAPGEGIRVDGFRWSDQAQDWVGTPESYTDATRTRDPAGPTSASTAVRGSSAARSSSRPSPVAGTTGCTGSGSTPSTPSGT